MASSARKTRTLYDATAAPPPTPSTLPSSGHLSTSGAADLLSSLLHRLPPTLSLPSRHRPLPTTPLPSLSFNDEWSTDFIASLTSATRLGFFEISGHGIPSELARSAEVDALALFDLPRDRKGSYFPRNWPLGYEPGDESGDDDGFGDSFCLDSQCSSAPADSEPLPLASLREFTPEMERVGLRVVEWLSGHVGFESPARDDPTRLCTFMWLARCSGHGKGDGENGLMSGGFYPFAVGLTYQIRCGQKYTLLADSGRVSVAPEVGSIMVTIGDLAQIWSNGKLKKVRGRPIPVPCSDSNTNLATAAGGTTMTMSLLITLPLDSTVSPLRLIPKATPSGTEQEGEAIEEQGDGEEEVKEEEEDNSTEKAVFGSFSFEDYAWRVYHARLSFKDPLDRYRIPSV